MEVLSQMECGIGRGRVRDRADGLNEDLQQFNTAFNALIDGGLVSEFIFKGLRFYCLPGNLEKFKTIMPPERFKSPRKVCEDCHLDDAVYIARLGEDTKCVCHVCVKKLMKPGASISFIDPGDENNPEAPLTAIASKVKSPPGAFYQDEITFDDLPKRQQEYLQAIVNGEPVVKNGATRLGLRRWGLIVIDDDWNNQRLTETGRKIVAHLVAPAKAA
jgi:hypothetical protein